MWTFSDIFEEGGFVSTPWAETFGIQTKYGVPKPSYRALQLLAGFPRTGLPVGAPGAAPTRPGAPPAAGAAATVGNVDVLAGVAPASGTGGLTELAALVANFNLNLVNAEDPAAGLPVATEAGVTVTWTGIPPGARLPANASLTLLDSAHGWAKPVWVAAGRPTYPSPAQVRAELDASALVPVGLPVTVAPGPGGTQTATVTLPPLEPYAVARLALQYATTTTTE
jgi:hypothetical protein